MQVRQPTGPGACLIRYRSKRRTGLGPNQKGKVRCGCRIIQRENLNTTTSKRRSVNADRSGWCVKLSRIGGKDTKGSLKWGSTGQQGWGIGG